MPSRSSWWAQLHRLVEGAVNVVHEVRRRHHPQVERAQCLLVEQDREPGGRAWIEEGDPPARSPRTLGEATICASRTSLQNGAGCRSGGCCDERCQDATGEVRSQGRCRVASTSETCIADSGTRSLVVPAVFASCWLQLRPRLAVAPRSSCRRVRLNGRPHCSLDPCGRVCIFLVEGLVLEQRTRERIELVPILLEQRNDLLV
jgi:hypothetical protein